MAPAAHPTGQAFAHYLSDLGDGGGVATISLSNGAQAIAGGQGLAIAPQGAVGSLLTSNASVAFFGVPSDGHPFDTIALQFAACAAVPGERTAPGFTRASQHDPD